MNRQILQVVRAEVTKAFRAPSFSIPTILLPVGFYVLFGLVMSGAARGTGPSYLLATYVVFAAMAPGLFGIGVTLAQERTSGWVDLLTASPAKPALLLVFPASRRFQTVPSRVASACQPVMLVSASGERQRCRLSRFSRGVHRQRCWWSR